MKKNRSCFTVVLFAALFVVIQVNAEDQNSQISEEYQNLETSEENKILLNDENQIPVNTEIQNALNAQEQNPPISEEGGYSLMNGIGRGFANLLAGWIEAPRGMVYYSIEYPVIGIIPGAFEGTGMTIIRTFGGAIDILTIGYLVPGDTVYDTMDAPMMPWESPWIPIPEDEDDLLDFSNY